MKKNILIIIFTFMLLLFSTEFVEAAKKRYICQYENEKEKIGAVFRLRLGRDGKVAATTALITGDFEGENIVNWDTALKGTNFTGQGYYEKTKKCPPYAYFFSGASKSAFLGISLAPNKFLVSDEAAGGKFEKKVRSNYDIDGDISVLKSIGMFEEEEEDGLPTSCMDFNERAAKCAEKDNCKIESDNYSCEQNPYFACIWNETTANPDGGYCNTDKLQYVMCGDSFDIPKDAPRLISFAVNFLKIITPIILIVISVITLLKALASSSEDQIKKAQKSLINKLIAAVIVFFVTTIVQFVIMKVADSSETESMSKCLSCFLNNDCEDNIYYKTSVGGEYFCTGINGDDVECR